MARIAFDVGGTFTDVILVRDDGDLVTLKVLSADGSFGPVVDGLVAGHIDPGSSVERYDHATTVASNMVIEGKVAPTGFVTSDGFRDILDMRGYRRPNLYDPTWERQPPVISGRLTRTLCGRILGSGSEDAPLDLEQVEHVLGDLVARGVEAVAVCLLNSYVNPAHEAAVREVARRCFPGLPVCLSHEVNPEIGEFDRASTTAINASLMPGVGAYLGRLEAGVTGMADRLRVMRSNGGVMSAAMARTFPAAMIESGPAAGVLAAAQLAKESHLANVLAFDMGGTTAKACLILHAVPVERPGGEVGVATTSVGRTSAGGGHVVRVPSFDIMEVGAGGGSLVWIDESGALRVGPRSAGSDSGPACYGRGGLEPTVADADVLLGYMDRGTIAGAALRIDREAATLAIDTKIAKPLDLDVLDAAFGIYQVANATMMRALRAVSTAKGHDPRSCTLVAFGGAAPMHAADLADLLGIREIRIPLYAGVFSALGLLFADHRSDYVRSVMQTVDELSSEGIASELRSMEDKALADMRSEGVRGVDVHFERHAELRYRGQGMAVPVEVPSHLGHEAVLGEFDGLLAAAHTAMFGYAPDAPTQVLSVRLRALGRRPAGRLVDFAQRAASRRGPAQRSQRPIYFGAGHGMVMTAVVDRWGIAARHDGPLVIEEPDTTIVVPPSWTVELDDLGSLVMQRVI